MMTGIGVCKEKMSASTRNFVTSEEERERSSMKRELLCKKVRWRSGLDNSGSDTKDFSKKKNQLKFKSSNMSICSIIVDINPLLKSEHVVDKCVMKAVSAAKGVAVETVVTAGRRPKQQGRLQNC